MAAGKDVALDEIHVVSVGLVEPVVDGDDLQRRPSARPKAVAQHGEIERPIFFADGLQHLDRHDPVEAAVQVAVVLKAQVDPVVEALGLQAPGREIELVPGDGDRRNVAAEFLRGPAAKATPAAADLQHMIVGPDARELGHAAVFVGLGRRQRLVRPVEDRGRVGHGRIEPERVEVVAEIVVPRDVAPGAALRIGPQPTPDARQHTGPRPRRATASAQSRSGSLGRPRRPGRGCRSRRLYRIRRTPRSRPARCAERPWGHAREGVLSAPGDCPGRCARRYGAR